MSNTNTERFSSRVQTTPEYDLAVAERADRWVAACGGIEEPFKHEGVRWLYVWNAATGEHAYLNLDTDLIDLDPPWVR